MKQTDKWRQRLGQVPLGILLLQILVGTAGALTPAIRTAGYKSVLVLGIVMSLVLPMAWMARRWGRDLPLPSLGRRTATYLALALVPPLTVIGAALIFTKRCEIGDGAAMLALGYMPGAFLCFALTELAEIWGGRGRFVLFGVLWFLILVQGILWFMFEPVYQVAHPLIGMMLGPPNERHEVLTPRVAWFALEVLCWGVAVLSISRLVELRKASRWFHVAALLAALVGAGALMLNDAELGYRIDSEHLMSGELRHVERSEGIKHVMSPLLPTDARPWLTLDAAFERERQRKLFGLDPDEMPATTIYWFRNTKHKQTLTGAGRTKFAKVHIGELYLSVDSFPVRTLAHELSHVTSGAFSHTPLRVPGRLGGIWYNPALVEGFAVAVAWSDKTLSAHEQARIALDKKRVPPLEELFSPLGFINHNLSVAYRTSGSFVRFCLDTYGPEPVVAWYGTEDFEASFGKPLDEVEREWKAFIQDDKMAAIFNRDVEGVDRVQSRPSIAQESCGKPGDERNLSKAMSAEADEEVERILDARAAKDGESAAIWYSRMKYKAQRSNYTCELPESPDLKLTKKLERRYAYLKALATWGRGDRKAAVALMDALPTSTKRSDDVIMARLLLQDGHEVSDLFIDAPMDTTLTLASLWKRTKHPVFGYKLARRLVRGQRWASLDELMDGLTWSGIRFPDGYEGTLVLATAEMRGQAAFAQRDWASAERAWSAYVKKAPSEGRRAYGETWLARTAFFEKHADKLKSNLPRM